MATAGYSGARPRGPLAGSSREAAQATAPGFGGALRALLDAGAGALRGSTRATLGLPGDLESLVRLLTGGETVLPTSEDLDRMLPGIEGHTAQTFDKVGEFVPLPVPPKAAGALAKAGYANLTAPGDMALQSQRGAVRLKGGNFNDARLAGYLGDTLNVHTPEYFDLIGDPAREGRAGAVGDWGRKQLKNYLRKDIGSPTDPLLQVEKEYPNLHLPEDQMWNPQEALRQRRMLSNSANREVDHYLNRHNELSGGAELTPWGYHSDQQLQAIDPQEYLDELAMGMYQPGDEIGDHLKWLTKAPSDTKIWGLVDPHTDDLGFGHVLDYLEAATKPSEALKMYGSTAEMRRVGNGLATRRDLLQQADLIDAGLALEPASLSRLSVADAVRKTAQWNELLKNAGVAGDPDLARGIVRTHKEYPEEGMKWVELGAPEKKLEDFGPEHFIHDLAKNKPESLAQMLKNEGKMDLRMGLNAEGKAMGHCVGGYCDEVANRGTKIYSLRDKNGNPHVTVEVRPGMLTSAQLDPVREAVWPKFGKGPYMSPGDNIAAQYSDAARADPSVGALTPLEWAAKQHNIPFPEKGQEIVQIKGKQNAAPVEKYLPYVQDFVKGGKWGRVGDLRNTGLMSREEFVRSGSFSPSKVGLEKRGIDYNDYLNRRSRYTPEQMELPEYFDESDVFKFLGYAEGGSILPQHKFLVTLKSIREEV